MSGGMAFFQVAFLAVRHYGKGEKIMPSILDRFLSDKNAKNNKTKSIVANPKDEGLQNDLQDGLKDDFKRDFAPKISQNPSDNISQDTFELSPENLPKSINEKIELKPDISSQNPKNDASKIIAHQNPLPQNPNDKNAHIAQEKKIILFDLDGTLLDSLEGIYASFCRACEEEEGVKSRIPSIEEVRKMIGLPLGEMFLRLGYEKSEIQSRITRYKNHYRRICIEQSRLYPQVREALAMASKFANLGVVTTKTGLYSKQILENFELLKYITVVIGIEDVSEPKPDAEPILRALSLLPITPKQKVYMIGDTILDIQSAKNAGVNALWVRCGYGEHLEGEADKSFDTVYEAVSYIKDI